MGRGRWFRLPRVPIDPPYGDLSRLDELDGLRYADDAWRLGAALDRMDEALTPAQEMRLAKVQEAEEAAATALTELLAWRKVTRTADPDGADAWSAHRRLADVADRLDGAA
jgi:hypothetical protein